MKLLYQVELNGEKLPIKTFKDYCNMYINASKSDEADEENKKLNLVYEKVNPRWEVCLSVCLFVCLCVCVSVCLSGCLSVYLFLKLSWVTASYGLLLTFSADSKSRLQFPQVAIGTSQKGFQQISFVNSIATTKGGTHVDYVSQQCVNKILAACQKKVNYL